MAVQESREPEYPGTTGYVLRRRERFWLGTIIFVYAFPGSLLTLFTIGYATGYPSVAEVIYFGLSFSWRCRDEKLRLGELATAVHTYAPGVPVWDAGKVRNPGEVTPTGGVE
jgi:hypothetical protein